MDDLPPYDQGGNLPNWSSDEKSNFKGKGRDLSGDDEHEASGHDGQLQVEGSPTLSSHGGQLTLSGTRGIQAATGPRMAVNQSIPTQRISASYFRPQATLDQPLDLGLNQHNSTGRNALVLRNSQTAVTPFRPPPGMSKDEQLALILSKNPDIDFDDVLKMLENAEDEHKDAADVPADMQLTSHAASAASSPQKMPPSHTGITVRPQANLSTVSRRQINNPSSSPQHYQQGATARSMVSYGGRASSISPSDSASQIPRTAAQQEDEDLQFALGLSRQADEQPASRPSEVHPGPRAVQFGRPLHNTSAPASNVSMSSLLQNSAAPRAVTPYQAVIPATPAQPLFSAGSTSSLLSGSHNALLSRSNLVIEQQRLADIAAIQNLQTERSAQRNMAEYDLYSQLSAPTEDRALKAQLALQRENLRDSKLATQMTALSLNQNRLAQMERHADEDEITAAQRRVDAESRRRFQLAQTEARKQESMEKARLRDRRHQANQEDLREQEERDRAYALELNQMQHDQVIEKVDAFGRNTQPLRRTCTIHPGYQNLDMRTNSSIDGDQREITYESGASTLWDEGGEPDNLQQWDDYERGNGNSRRGHSASSFVGKGRGKGKGKRN